MGTALRAAVVGCHGIGRSHAEAIMRAQRVELAALCDIDVAQAEALAETSGAPPVFTDYGTMLGDLEPDIVALGVPTALHESMAVQAAEAGVRGIVGEKPMAGDLSQARRMIEAADRAGAGLIVNHQRRMRREMVRMRALIEQGAIGDLRIVRGNCAGDVLTDGTHAIDSLRFLAGDLPVDWLIGTVHCAPIVPGQKLGKAVEDRGGRRYRHGMPIESGAIACWQFADGPRAELFTGDCREPGTPYQDYVAVGTEGRLWRPGDAGNPGALLLQDSAGGWRPVELDPEPDGIEVFARSYDVLAECIESGTEHPLRAANGCAALEVIMAVYESSRRRARVVFPLKEERNPMELMVADGAFPVG